MALIDYGLIKATTPLSDALAGPLDLRRILGWLFTPLAWLLGLAESDLTAASRILGGRAILTEVVAYQELGRLGAEGAISPRTILILSYTLCGFAHVASVGIFIGGIGALAPERRGDLSSLGIRALVGATLATLMTGALAGSTTTARQGCWASECPWPPTSVMGHANGARAGLKPAPTPRRDVVPILSGSACE